MPSSSRCTRPRSASIRSPASRTRGTVLRWSSRYGDLDSRQQIGDQIVVKRVERGFATHHGNIGKLDGDTHVAAQHLNAVKCEVQRRQSDVVGSRASCFATELKVLPSSRSIALHALASPNPSETPPARLTPRPQPASLCPGVLASRAASSPLLRARPARRLHRGRSSVARSAFVRARRPSPILRAAIRWLPRRELSSPRPGRLAPGMLGPTCSRLPATDAIEPAGAARAFPGCGRATSTDSVAAIAALRLCCDRRRPANHESGLAVGAIAPVRRAGLGTNPPIFDEHRRREGTPRASLLVPSIGRASTAGPLPFARDQDGVRLGAGRFVLGPWAALPLPERTVGSLPQ